MPQHDAYARYTPYELAIPGREFAEERFRAITEELKARDVDTDEPATFVMVKAAHDTLEEIQGPAEDDPVATRQHAVLLYHAYHFHRAGEPLYLLGTHAARYLVEAEPAVEAPPSPPSPAGYLQLPQHLFWSEPMEDHPPESVDGIFWCTPDGARLSALLILGMRGDRPGMSVVPVPMVPLAEADIWAREEAREGGKDFAGTLPGSEIDHLYSVETAGEALKLLARVFWYLESDPDTVREEEGEGVWTDPEDPEGPPSDRVPRPSSLSFRKILLESQNESEEA